RQNALRMPLQSNTKVQILLYFIDYTEVRSIIGRTKLNIVEIPVRGLVKLEVATLFQTAIPTKGEDALQVIAAIQQEAKEMDAYWEGDRPRPIPMVPEKLLFDDLKGWKTTRSIYQNKGVAFAVDTVDVLPIPFHIEKE